ncbi:MAG: hypothetical protein ACHQ53_14420, partial [Polyangiales bacterium]
SAWLDVVREARRRPLPFDLDMARAYQQALHGGADLREARRAAAESFEGDFGAKNDPYVRLIHPSFESIADAQGPLGFEALCKAVLEPFLLHRSVV